MKVIGKGCIFNSAEATGPKRVCSFTSLLKLSPGKILATFRLGSSKESADGNCCIAESTDEGFSWEIISDGFETVYNGTPGEAREAELVALGDSELLGFFSWFDRTSGDGVSYDAETDTPRPTKLRMARSSDGGRTWSDYETLETGNLKCPVLGGPTVHLPGKGWFVPFENFAPEAENGPSVHSGHALFSSDGKSFDKVLNVARHPDDLLRYYDQRNALCPKTQRPVTMFWTYNGKTEKDVEIHLAWGDPETLEWPQPVSTGIQGQIAAPIPLVDGRLLAFYVHRHHPGSLRLIASADGGKTWDHDNELIVYAAQATQNSGPEVETNFARLWEEMAVWSFGHPTAVVLDEKTLLLAYYAGDRENCLSAHWARVEI